MAYVVVVFAIINTAALGAVGWLLWAAFKDIPVIVGTAIADEVRRQDERIEKRQQRARGPEEDVGPTALDGRGAEGVVAGRPTRHR